MPPGWMPTPSGATTSWKVGPDLLRRLVPRSRFRWVSANVRDASWPSEVFAAEQGARRFTVERIGALQVGITGVASSDVDTRACVDVARRWPEGRRGWVLFPWQCRCA
jgi:2',3'-cyclic-nucleotide 2'-phosphodiesterase (5'-nucleotidase family)